MRPKLLLTGTLVLAGCAASAGTEEPEFVLRDVSSKSLSDHQGMDMLMVEGHGKRCYVAAFGMSKVLLWCEDIGKGAK